ncbi:GNAT family N-acetyltransferase [Aquibacillus koreensis]|uniref:GNAT family N-acetyltransferase n=1 Tax=Aquibacillus koreensis TaxID=279446 RepID=A0A9X4AGU3_9BACI|nr:GNAT family N-acetyltransferase [Aquibacillus koreensis]MCT2535004.1 GNAT family N-acetyltransferase [Aquibacillus koreensis]MDC3419291.1 GNAT family N-acetyltransferase [Aquibacillus koreensis]
MEHKKTYHSKTIESDSGPIIVEGPLTSSDLRHCTFHEKLTAFRPANKQFQALIEIAELEEGRILVCRDGTMIVGYVTFLFPDPLERWSTFNMKNLLELGAIEIAPGYRGLKLGSSLIEVAMMDEMMEHYIVISTEYYWHWDLKETQLSVWDYRKIMEKMMSAGGLTPAPTDDMEIISHPANCLMVRIGKHVPNESITLFDRLRFLQQEKYKSQKKV